MPRSLYITDQKKRDAHVQFTSVTFKRDVRFVDTNGQPVSSQRYIKSTEKHTYEALLTRFDNDDALSDALVAGDPEIDISNVGREVGAADRVYVRADGSVLYSARVLSVVYDAKGEETARDEFVDVEATVSDAIALPWSGRLFPIDTVVRRFVITRRLQLRHVNGLTFDFLQGIAQHLSESDQMLLVGAGAKGTQPLIMQTNGSPYRGFLEGRLVEDGYILLLHLSNLELKRSDA